MFGARRNRRTRGDSTPRGSHCPPRRCGDQRRNLVDIRTCRVGATIGRTSCAGTAGRGGSAAGARCRRTRRYGADGEHERASDLHAAVGCRHAERKIRRCRQTRPRHLREHASTREELRRERIELRELASRRGTQGEHRFRLHAAGAWQSAAFEQIAAAVVHQWSTQPT